MLGPLLEVKMLKKCTRLWREAHFQVKRYKAHQVRTTFGSCDVRKSARRCGAKHISKSKCTKHQGFGPLLEVAMSKKCTPLCAAKHIFKSKVLKTEARTLSDLLEVQMVEKVSKKCTPLWREAHLEVKSVKKVRVLSLF